MAASGSSRIFEQLKFFSVCNVFVIIVSHTHLKIVMVFLDIKDKFFVNGYLVSGFVTLLCSCR